MGVAVRFGLGVLATRILLNQFQVIPPMVAFYKFFTVDRHLLRDRVVEKTDPRRTSEETRSES